MMMTNPRKPNGYLSPQLDRQIQASSFYFDPIAPLVDLSSCFVHSDAFEEPDGKENCLEGLTFVFTGELTTMSREQGSDLVKKYGGQVSHSLRLFHATDGDSYRRVTSAPSGKTSYVVVGSDAGPKKLEMIKAKKIKTLDEAQFLQLINQRPAGEADEKFMAKKVEEEKKIVSEAKKMLSKDAPCANSLSLFWLRTHI